MTGKGYPDLTTSRFVSTVRIMRPHLPMYILADFDPHGIAIIHNYRWGSRRLAHENTVVEQLQWLGITSRHLFPSAIGMEGSGTSELHIDQTTPSQVESEYGGDSGDDFEDWSHSNGSFKLGSFASSQSQDALRFEIVPPLPRHLECAEGVCLARTGANQRPIEDTRLFLTPADRKKARDTIEDLHLGDQHDPERMESVRELQVMLMLNLKAEIQAVDRLGDMTDWLDERLASSQEHA